ncbi:MAG: hypothetical protein WCK02_02100 [Bacteroidota bacterium]
MEFEFIEYMRNIAIELKTISHKENSEMQKRFYRVSGLNGIEEVLNSLSDSKMYPALLANDLEVGKVGDSGPSENYLNLQSHIFYIVGYVSSNDFNGKEQSLRELKLMMYKIIGKMRKDKREDFQGIIPRTGLRNLDTRSFYYQVISGFGENCHGIMVSFDISPVVENEIKFNVSDWN